LNGDRAEGDKSAQTTAIARRRSLAAAASGNRSAPVCARLKSRGRNEETGSLATNELQSR
jgi:hypothetical protein